MKTFSQFVAEAAVSNRTTALLPATEYHAGDGKKKATIADIMKSEKGMGLKTTIQIAHVEPHTTWDSGEYREPAKPKLRFVVGSGHGGYEDKFNAHHDQTGAKLGLHRIVNQIHLTDGEIVHKDNDKHLNDKAPTAVYK